MMRHELHFAAGKQIEQRLYRPGNEGRSVLMKFWK